MDNPPLPQQDIDDLKKLRIRIALGRPITWAETRRLFFLATGDHIADPPLRCPTCHGEGFIPRQDLNKPEYSDDAVAKALERYA